jgi:hypothetical protein
VTEPVTSKTPKSPVGGGSGGGSTPTISLPAATPNTTAPVTETIENTTDAVGGTVTGAVDTIENTGDSVGQAVGGTNPIEGAAGDAVQQVGGSITG